MIYLFIVLVSTSIGLVIGYAVGSKYEIKAIKREDRPDDYDDFDDEYDGKR